MVRFLHGIQLGYPLEFFDSNSFHSSDFQSKRFPRHNLAVFQQVWVKHFATLFTQFSGKPVFRIQVQSVRFCLIEFALLTNNIFHFTNPQNFSGNLNRPPHYTIRQVRQNTTGKFSTFLRELHNRPHTHFLSKILQFNQNFTIKIAKKTGAEAPDILF